MFFERLIFASSCNVQVLTKHSHTHDQPSFWVFENCWSNRRQDRRQDGPFEIAWQSLFQFQVIKCKLIIEDVTSLVSLSSPIFDDHYVRAARKALSWMWTFWLRGADDNRPLFLSLVWLKSKKRAPEVFKSFGILISLKYARQLASDDDFRFKPAHAPPKSCQENLQRVMWPCQETVMDGFGVTKVGWPGLNPTWPSKQRVSPWTCTTSSLTTISRSPTSRWAYVGTQSQPLHSEERSGRLLANFGENRIENWK